MKTKGVSVEFFCSAIKTLTKLHGNRYAGPHGNRFVAALSAVEEEYKKLELVPKPSTRKPKK